MNEPRRAAHAGAALPSLLLAVVSVAAAASAAFLETGRDLGDPPPVTLPEAPLETLVYTDESVVLSASALWQKLLLRVPSRQVARHPALWRHLHFDDWDTLPEDLRVAGLRALVERYRPLIEGGAGAWARLGPDGWDHVPQPIRALAYLRMVRSWAEHYAAAADVDEQEDGIVLSADELAATVGAIVMVESWFEHRAVNANDAGNRDLGLAQASDYLRTVLPRLHRRGRVDFAPVDDEAYFDPWQATRVAVMWFVLMLDEAAGDADVAVRAYHAGIGPARRGAAQEYLDNVQHKRRRYVLAQGAPPAWQRLRLLVERPWLGPPVPAGLLRVDPAVTPHAAPRPPWRNWPEPAPTEEPPPVSVRVVQPRSATAASDRLAAFVEDVRSRATRLVHGRHRLEAHLALASAQLHFTAGRYREALAAYGRAVGADPGLRARTLAPMAFAHDRLRHASPRGSFAWRTHLDSAVAGYEAALRAAHDDAQRCTLLGWLALAYGPEGRRDRTRLVTTLERLRDLDPQRAEVHLALAQIHEASGDAEAAEATLRRGRQACPHSRALAHVLVLLIERRDRTAALLAELRAQRRRWPHTAEVHAALALRCWDVLDPGPAFAAPDPATSGPDAATPRVADTTDGADEAAAQERRAPRAPDAALRELCHREGERSADAALGLSPADPFATSLKSLYLRLRAAEETDEERRADLEQRAAVLRARVAAEKRARFGS